MVAPIAVISLHIDRSVRDPVIFRGVAFGGHRRSTKAAGQNHEGNRNEVGASAAITDHWWRHRIAGSCHDNATRGSLNPSGWDGGSRAWATWRPGRRGNPATRTRYGGVAAHSHKCGGDGSSSSYSGPDG